MGVFEMEPFAKGTIAVCEALANLDDANTIIGGGSVVTKDIPKNCLAFGNPCKVIRKITTSD